MAKEVITELEVLFTANTAPVDKAAKDVQAKAQKIERTPVKQKVDGDAKGALDSMDRVEAAAKKIVSAKTMATVDANIGKAEKNLATVRERLDYLHSIEATMEVTADIKRAETALRQIERRRDGLVAARESMVVDANTAPAKAALDDLADEAGAAGSEAGDEAGDGLSAGIIAALATIPFAGAVVGIGAAIGESLLDGLQSEVRSDRLMATTGLDAATVGRLARAAGEAYASNWGESLEANMDTARVAIQQGLLDPAATERDARAVIQSLSGVADIIGGDIARTSQATATLIRSGLVKNADEAFDVIVRGFQVGNDKAEDWLDTLIEYPAVLTRLGLDGAEATGLINQGLVAGARNADFVADALKEFQIRATDASETSARGYELIGLSAADMTAKIAQGGEGAREGLDQVLDGLRAMEDPVARNEAAVALFGTKAEDLGEALFALDLDTVAADLGEFAGAAETALGVLTDNAANDIASAQRNIEVATDGIKGALAAAFNPQIEDFATWVSSNREQIMQFLLDIANGGLDFARSFVEGTASATEAIGDFISGPVADLADGIADILDGMSFAGLGVPGAQGAASDLRGFVDQMRDVEEGTEALAQAMRENIIENGINPVQDRLNDIAIPEIVEARLHDTTVRLAADIDGVGLAADGSALALDDMRLANLRSTEAGRALDEQLRAATEGMRQQVVDGMEAGKTQGELAGQYDVARQALMDQLVAMGLTEQQTADLVTQYGLVPDFVKTTVEAETETAAAKIDEFTKRKWRTVVQVDTVGGSAVYSTAPGNRDVMRYMAAGGPLPLPAWDQPIGVSVR